ncbi:MAG: response regulator [Leptospiraceae bacterium]
MLKEKPHILLVEDDGPTASLQKRTLEKNGYCVTIATCGEEAVELCSQEFDLVLMDIDLGPGIKGTEAARIIQDTYDLPLAFLSSHTDRPTVELTEGITSYGYILKTSGPVVLIASIKMVFRLHEARERESEQRRRLRDIRPPEEEPRLLARIEELKRNSEQYANSGHWQHQKKDGSLIHVEISSHGLDFRIQRKLDWKISCFFLSACIKELYLSLADSSVNERARSNLRRIAGSL